MATANFEANAAVASGMARFALADEEGADDVAGVELQFRHREGHREGRMTVNNDRGNEGAGCKYVSTS